MQVATEAKPDGGQWEDLLVRVEGVPARALERDRDRQGRGDARDRRRADEPGRLGADRDRQGARRRAARTPTQLLAGSVVASDAFFPFPDGPQLAIDAGVTALVQPGGSVRDDEVIAACDEAGAAMVFTGPAALPALSVQAGDAQAARAARVLRPRTGAAATRSACSSTAARSRRATARRIAAELGFAETVFVDDAGARRDPHLHPGGGAAVRRPSGGGDGVAARARARARSAALRPPGGRGAGARARAG